MSPQFDAIVAGAGIMGSAVAFELARRGKKVLLLDRWEPPHRFGSSHGETRVIREAYFEHPDYVPLVQRAWELWRELEAESGTSLLRATGGLMIGDPAGTVFSGALQSARRHRLDHECLTAASIRSRFPALNVPPEFEALLESRAGLLHVEDCHRALLELAQNAGARTAWYQPVTGWSVEEGGVRVRAGESEYRARWLILSCGAWIRDRVPELRERLAVERQVQHWFRPVEHQELFSPDRLPVHVWEYEPGRYFYVIPDVGRGVKAALHHQGIHTTADQVDRDVAPDEKRAMQHLVARFLPGLNSPPERSEVCLYTNTRDGHFLIDRLPDGGNVLLVSPCSGHGFKFAPVIGEIAAEWVLHGRSLRDLSLFQFR